MRSVDDKLFDNTKSMIIVNDKKQTKFIIYMLINKVLIMYHDVKPDLGLDGFGDYLKVSQTTLDDINRSYEKTLEQDEESRLIN